MFDTLLQLYQWEITRVIVSPLIIITGPYQQARDQVIFKISYIWP
jgi:hypothetical protein